ncbi:hypothetical protein B9Z19DRAFT_1127007 [Tuber borchii]|uniref:Uncharacterized protein n=1 Tax=Tuber borchii TaxID=42251 RepID=A0A2T6ZS50_TUBBO|nr:hypothetical protein B9Z19DRAFT_1127007 [Tuber borchii]
MWIRLLPTLLLLQIIAVQAEWRFQDFSVSPKWIELKGFSKDGCQEELDFDATIDESCRIISSTGITNVVVVARDSLPSTCILTLYADDDCKGDSYAQIGPITPTSVPSVCIGPIQNPAGELFGAKAASIKC